MIRTMTVACAFAGLLATGAIAEATEEQKDALVAAIEANGCAINGDTAEAILAAAALAPEDAEAVLDALGEAGEMAGATVTLARADDGSVTLTSPGCPG